MSILITGGAGYIGSHTAVELIKVGYEIIIVDNFINSNVKVMERMSELCGKEIKYYHVDITKSDEIETVFMENDIDAVIHFAGLKAVGESVSVPLTYYLNNVTGTIILCEAMKKFQVKKIVFSSSATVYGNPEKVPIDEEQLLNPINPYGRTKMMIEEILKDLYVSDQEWSISLLRYFNPIGAHESGLIGEQPNGVPNNLMPYIAQVAIGRLPYLRVFGIHYPTIDGTGVRDYIHVVDLAKGHVKALEKVLSSQGVHIYNLGTGQGYSVFQVISTFEKVNGVKVPYVIAPTRQGDIPICYANPKKAFEELGWKAEKGLEEMCQDTWRWQQKNPYGYLS